MTYWNSDPKPTKKIKEPYKGLKRAYIKKKLIIKDGDEIDGAPDLIKELDRVMSEFVRLSNANPHGIVKCFTCDNKAHWTEMQNGHYVPRKNMATRFLLWNTMPQCAPCNESLSGNLSVYKIKLDEKHGTGTADHLTSLGKTTCKRPAYEYEELIQSYRVLVKNLKTSLLINARP